MSYITSASGICISAPGSTWTNPPAFPCHCPCQVTLGAGKSVEIINTCTLGFTITGFTNSDPLRFTLFKFPKYSGLSTYSTGNGVTELPLTLGPYEVAKIPTFFHPTEHELASGTAGTYEIRDGDSWGSRVDVYPGFPVLNCEDTSESCESYFTLSGELICDEISVPDWLSNDANFVAPTDSVVAFPTVQGSYCIPATGIFESPVPDGWQQNPIPAAFSGLVLATEKVQVFLEKEADYSSPILFPEIPRAGWSGGLSTFKHLIEDLQVTGSGFTGDRDFRSIITGKSGSWVPTVVLAEDVPVLMQNTLPSEGFPSEKELLVSGTYRGNNAYETVGFTGLNIDIATHDSNRSKGAVITNSTVWFSHDATAVPPTVSLFLSNSGDFASDVFCE